LERRPIQIQEKEGTKPEKILAEKKSALVNNLGFGLGVHLHFPGKMVTPLFFYSNY
jgi:hypothetical protein